VAVQEKLYTVDDLWQMSQEMGVKRLELIEGVIEEMSPTGEEHGDIASELNMLIRQHVKAHRLGRVTAAETGYILHTSAKGKHTVLAPDVGFISKERATPTPNKKFVIAAPDLAVEVVSPSETYTKVAKKVALYLRYKTRLAWVVDPDSKTVAVHTSAGSRTLGLNDTLDGGDVLPGFTLAVKDIFAG